MVIRSLAAIWVQHGTKEKTNEKHRGETEMGRNNENLGVTVAQWVGAVASQLEGAFIQPTSGLHAQVFSRSTLNCMWVWTAFSLSAQWLTGDSEWMNHVTSCQHIILCFCCIEITPETFEFEEFITLRKQLSMRSQCFPRVNHTYKWISSHLI